MKNLNFIILIFAILSFNFVYSQTPQIKWWYDVNDSAFGNSASADLDGDGKLEIAFSCYRNDSTIYVLNAEDGSLLWKVNTGGCNDAAPLIFDVDMDDTLEVILAGSCVPKTFCFSGPTGEIEWETPLHGSDSPPTVGDIDNDGKPEILHGCFGGYVACFNGEDGSVAWDLAVDLNSWIQTAPIILDVDNNGQLDFVVGNWNFGTDHKIFCFRGNDQYLLWETELPNDYMYHGASFADIDADGYMELAIGTYDGTLLVLNAENGSLKWEYSFSNPFYIGAPTSIADLNNDTIYEIVFFDAWNLGVLSSTGDLLWEFPIPSYAYPFRGAAISDINNDDTLDVVFGTSNGEVYALHGSSGNEIWSIDLAAHHDSVEFDIDHAPIIADFDGDSLLDIFVVGGRTDYPEIETNYGRAYAISCESKGGPDWLMFRKDTVRSACVKLDTASMPSNPVYPFDSSSTAFENLNTISIINFESIVKIENNYLIETYPNPVSEYLNIEYKLKTKTKVNISLYNYFGLRIADIENSTQKKGSYFKKLESNFIRNLENGLYLLKFQFNQQIVVKKLLVQN